MKRIALRRSTIRSCMRAGIVAIVLAAIGGAVSGCGQRGPLYLPDKENPDRRR